MTAAQPSPTMTNERLAGFTQHKIDTGEAVINTFVRGSGEPLLMLHGYPQTHLMWHKVAPALAEKYTVVLTDLRGYGDSSCPPDGENHLGYSKRAMARDQVEVMRQLGFERFYLAGHDRGARVCHQMLLDYPEKKVRRAVLLDIIPTSEMYARTDKEFASIYFHWFFLILPNDLPEKLLAGNPEAWIRRTAGSLGSRGGGDAFPEDVMAHYVEKFSNPAVIHATCEDYRAGATVDLEHIAAAGARGKIPVPLLVLWAAPYLRNLSEPDVLGIWRQHAADVTGYPVPGCGHFIAEEAPEETIKAIRHFFDDKG
ncbi:alpha/beta hydrolase [Opitutaceae bacterium TAV3]|nr:alpha/beta hydrolase [Opitutaceae bacterium TAV3]